MPVGRGKDLASWEALAWEDATWGTLLSGWEIALSPLGVLPACLDCQEYLGKDCTLCLGRSAVHWGSLGTACLGGLTLCWERVLLPGDAWGLPAWEDQVLPAWEITLSAWGKGVSAREAGGIACLRDCTVCLGKSAIYWESMGIACLGRALSAWEAWGEALGVDLAAWELLAACEGLSGQGYLPVICLGVGPSGWENLRAMPNYTSFLFIY